MFGSKLRSWMEAVRSRKKQHRKEKPGKCTNGISTQKHNVTWDTNHTDVIRDFKETDRRDVFSGLPSQSHPGTSDVSNTGHSRYSANNLSSPESAYSTGYSTDGTSPGAPPENLLNTSKHSNGRITILNAGLSPNSSRIRHLGTTTAVLTPNNPNLVTNQPKQPLTPILKIRDAEEAKVIPQQPNRTREPIVAPGSPALGMTSPRQRNRIRTNPWVPSGNVSPSPVKQTTIPSKFTRDSPRIRRLLSPATSRRRSLSSSSCSSLSGASIQLEVPRARSVSDEDCTLNEMMGKYDESYVYEKETDILSDSDPTDCETDIDTGQDGGDEDDPFEGELDFIDNCSHLEFESKTDHNTGHCSYYTYDVQRKRSSRRRATRRSNKCSEKKRRSCSNKKRYSKSERERCNFIFSDGSKSAGATPLSVRRANSRPVSKLILQDCLRRRSNSIGFYRDHINTIDKRDKEADLKYRELITETEHILRAMKTNGLSPRRVPGPANKRVELLRSTECAKPEIFTKNRMPIMEDNTVNNSFCSKIPSNNCSRFSPKKNHITKFIISNSPILVKKEWEMQNNMYVSPISHRKILEKPQLERKTYTDKLGGNRKSPKHKRSCNKSHIGSSSGSEDETERQIFNRDKTCPQSEPVRRKVYFGHNNYKTGGYGKTVEFNMDKNMTKNIPKTQFSTNSTENLRQQVLLNTLVNLKRNLEDHSASLKQVYRSSHDLYV